jgi:hypothetical protein
MNDELVFGAESPNGGFYLNRLVEILVSERRALKLNGPLFICQWAAVAYLYFRRMRAYPDIGEAALTVCKEAVDLCMETGMVEEAVGAALRMAEWAVSTRSNAAGDLVVAVEALYTQVPPELSVKIAGTLATDVGTMSSQTPTEWANLVFQNHWVLADPGVRLAVLGRLAPTISFEMYQAEFMAAMEAFSEPAGKADRYDREQHLEADFRAIYPVLYVLLRAGKVDTVLSVLGGWYGVDPAETVRDALVVAPAFEYVSLWLSKIAAQEVPHPVSQALTKAVMAGNRALRLVLTLDSGETGFEDSGPFDPRQHGLPDARQSSEFESACSNFLALDGLNSAALPASSTPLIFLSSLSVPVQALTLKKFARTWPITVSLRLPLPERSVRRVGIWHHPLLHGEWEIQMLQACFERAGIHCQIEVSGGADERERFAALYSSPELDVVWIIGHGDNPAYEPDNARLLIFESSEIGVKELMALPVPAVGSSRLLVLNICSGAAAVTYGGLPRVSIAALLTSERQKLVSHLWPVHPLSASVLGGFIANGLSKGLRYFEAYSEAVLALGRSRDLVAASLSVLPGSSPEIARAVADSTYDFECLINAGSSVYFE